MGKRFIRFRFSAADGEDSPLVWDRLDDKRDVRSFESWECVGWEMVERGIPSVFSGAGVSSVLGMIARGAAASFIPMSNDDGWEERCARGRDGTAVWTGRGGGVCGFGSISKADHITITYIGSAGAQSPS